MTMNNQPIVVDEAGVMRFKVNVVVRLLLDAHLDLNTIWVMYQRGAFTEADMMQFYQLLGYSIDGFWEVFDDGTPLEAELQAALVREQSKIGRSKRSGDS
jgi:hypothetical protein